MNYASGEEIRLWDRIEAWPGCSGIIVFTIDNHQFSPRFPEAQWSYLRTGVMLDIETAGLVHVDEADEDLRLLQRGEPPTPDEWASLRRVQFTQPNSEWRSGEGASVQIGSVNRHGQICTGHRGVPGTDHLQRSYRTECGHCGLVYGANGSDMHERRCPACQGGAQGIPF
jgi:hypothetical protein